MSLDKNGAVSLFTSSIPAELRDPKLVQWVAWKVAIRGGKPTKVLVNPHTGENADATDPATWGTLDEASARAASDGLAGVGFVFTEHDPYCGVDFDHCIDPETGGFTDEKAAYWVRELNSYTEVSPSGTGVHVIGRGVLPERGRKRGNREMYDARRFFTVTGKHLEGTPTTIRNAQKELLALHADTFPDAAAAPGPTSSPTGQTAGGYEVWNNGLTDEQVIVKAASAKHGEKFRRLFYDGDTSGHAGDDSAADMALVATVAFWTGPDPEQIERIVRQSSLARGKWDEPRAGGSWIRYTIDNALRDRTEFYTGADSDRNSFQFNIYNPPEKKKMEFTTVPAILATAGKRAPWVTEPFAVRGGVTDLVGPAKHAGKTTLLAHMMRHVHSGTPFLGRPTEQTPIVFLTEQGSNLSKPLRDAGLDRDNEHLYILPWRCTMGRTWGEVVETAQEKVRETGAGFMLVDTLNRFAGLQGEDENKPGPVMEALRPLIALAQEENVAVLSVRHANKLGYGRGSTAFEHDVDILLTLSRPPAGYDANVRQLAGVGRYDGIPDKLMIELTDGGYRSLGSGTDAAFRAALDIAREEAPVGEDAAVKRTAFVDTLHEEFGVSKSTAGRAVSKLIKDGTFGCLGAGKKGDPHRIYALFSPEEREEMVNSIRFNSGGQGGKPKMGKSLSGGNPIGKGKTPPSDSIQLDSIQSVSEPLESNNSGEFDTPPDNPVPSSAYELRGAVERLGRPTQEELAAELGVPVSVVAEHLDTGVRGGIFYEEAGRYSTRPFSEVIKVYDFGDAGEGG